MATAQLIRDVMTAGPVCLRDSAYITEAAHRMREHGIGDVLIVDDQGRLEGVVTDRDIVVRGLAEGLDPTRARLSEVVSTGCVTVRPDQSVDDAVDLMREHLLRRLPVVEAGQPVGVVSIGDLAVERAPDSALADISSAPPNL